MIFKRPKIVWPVFLLVTLETLFSVPFLSWELALGRRLLLGGLTSLAAVAFIALVFWRGLDFFRAALQRVSDGLNKVCGSGLLTVSVIAGLILRVLWVLQYRVPQHSDQAIYFGLARSLVEHHSYSIAQMGLAYWPPGYPFFLAAWVFIFGFKTWVPLLANLSLFVASVLVVRTIAHRIGGVPAARFSLLLLAFWPTMIMTAGMASKEMLVLFLLCWALLVFQNAQDSGLTPRGISLTFFAGILLALAALTQPSLMLFPSVLLALEWFRRTPIPQAVLRLALLGITMVLVICPWTLRNHRVLHAWVPISTNGGDVFYRANNPLATGGYTPAGQQSLENYDEVQRGRVGFQLGKEWIRAHPGRFLVLAVQKEVLFLGDDAQGAFETLKRGLGIGGIRYLAWKGISNLFWWVLWMVILLELLIHWRGPLAENPLLASAMLSVLYLFTIHSVFESGSKYHEPLFGLIAVIAAQVVAAKSPLAALSD